MTIKIYKCRFCGSANVEFWGYDDAATELWRCHNCGVTQSYSELDEEWESSFDNDEDDISGNPDLSIVSGGRD